METTATNLDRAGWAEIAITAFEAVTRTDREDSLCDLLADLMHWSDAEGMDFDNELRKARYHYDAELTEASAKEYEAEKERSVMVGVEEYLQGQLDLIRVGLRRLDDDRFMPMVVRHQIKTEGYRKLDAYGQALDMVRDRLREANHLTPAAS